MKKSIFVITLFLSNIAWAMQPEKHSIEYINYYSSGRLVTLKRINPNKNTFPLYEDGCDTVKNIIRYSGFHTPIKNKSILETLVELNDKKDAPCLIRLFFCYKEKNKKKSKAKL
jgi:hypothetical protein